MGVCDMKKSFLSEYQNKKILMDGLVLLRQLPMESIACSFFDPQYREILDKLKYGNEGKGRQKSRIALPQMSEEVIINFLAEQIRVIKPSGYIFFWGDKFILGEGQHIKYMNAANEFILKDTFLDNRESKKQKIKFVDYLIWDKRRMGMGYRTRRRFEPLFIFQKLPTEAKRTWKDKGIPDVWEERIMQPKSKHPHTKPRHLLMDLINSVTQKGDTICDPCAGSFLVMDSAQLHNRNFIGCDISPKYADVKADIT